MGSQQFWRTFVAFPLSEGTCDALAREAVRIGALDDRARIVPAANMHLTVAFLGPTPPEEIPSIAKALEKAVRGTGPIDVRIDGLGAFPRPESAHVVWAGVIEEGGGDRLVRLAGRVGEALSEIGYRIEARRYHAHVTLARLEGRHPSEALKIALTAGHLQDTYTSETLSDLHLMISEHASAADPPRRGGSRGRSGVNSGGNPESRTRYRPVATVPLEDQPSESPSEDDADEDDAE